jgi:glycosyltransferase involved in cell wall biosynthesis
MSGATERPIVTFAIPLAPMSTVADWRLRGRILSATLTAIYRQTDPRFRILLAGDRMPALTIPLDERCELIEVGSEHGRNYRSSLGDKEAKLARLAERFAPDGGGYFMPLDMDDLVSRQLVAHVAATLHPNGYIFTHGYVMDARRGLLAPMPGEGPGASFDQLCGSSAVIHLLPEDVEAKPDGSRSRFADLMKGGHQGCAAAAVAEGRPFSAVPFRAAVWVVNHGANLSTLASRERVERTAAWRGVLSFAGQGRPPDEKERDKFSIPDAYPVRDDATQPDAAERQSAGSTEVAIVTSAMEPLATQAIGAPTRPAAAGREAPLVTFAIPLVPLGSPAQKAYRDRMLSATLRSIYAQTDGSFRVMLIGDREPRIDFPTDDRIEFVPFRSRRVLNTAAADADKEGKLSLAGSIFGSRGGGYFMPVDMDDFVSRQLVAFVRETRDPNGYLIERGYVLDARRMTVTPIPDPRYHVPPYHRTCGSCTIFNFTPADVLPGGRFSRLKREGHYSNAEVALAEGRPLRAIPFLAGVYTVNHGRNLTTTVAIEKGKVAERQRWVEGLGQYSIPASHVAAEFGLPDHYPLTADEPLPPVERPTLTVVIATYRRPAGLRRLLLALRPQVEQSPGRDIVVVNDGSHDDAYQKVLSEFHDIIQYQALPKNVGVAGARNAGAQMAGGDYLVFTDDDCQPPLWWLDWLATRLQRSPDLDVVAGPTDPLWRAGKRGLVARVQAHYGFIPMAFRREGTILFVTANVAIRRSLLELVGGFGFPGKFHGAGEDTELARRLSLVGASIRIDNEWRVGHDVGEPFRALCRRSWLYGYANGAMTALNTAPAFSDDHVWPTRAGNVRNWVAHYREFRQSSTGLSRWWIGRAVGAFIGSLIRFAYFEGVAAAARDAGRRRPRPSLRLHAATDR